MTDDFFDFYLRVYFTIAFGPFLVLLWLIALVITSVRLINYTREVRIRATEPVEQAGSNREAELLMRRSLLQLLLLFAGAAALSGFITTS